MRLQGCALATLLCFTVVHAYIDGRCYQTSLSNSTLQSKFKYVFKCDRVPAWKLPSVIWAPLDLEVNCTTFQVQRLPWAWLAVGALQFALYMASSEEQLAGYLELGHASGCGLLSALADGRTCSREVLPLQSTLVGITVKEYPGRWHSCQVSFRQQPPDPMRILLTLAGALLFLNARHCATSLTFRLTAGTLATVLLSLIVLLFLLLRTVPHKGKVAGAFLTVGGTMLSAVRWIYGTWLPSLEQLVFNPWFQAYVGVAAAVGLGLSYYWEDRLHYKINNMFRWGLQAAGLAVLVMSTTSWAVSGAFVAALLLYQWLQPYLPRLYRVWRRASRPPPSVVTHGQWEARRKEIYYDAEEEATNSEAPSTSYQAHSTASSAQQTQRYRHPQPELPPALPPVQGHLNGRPRLQGLRTAAAAALPMPAASGAADDALQRAAGTSLPSGGATPTAQPISQAFKYLRHQQGPPQSPAAAAAENAARATASGRVDNVAASSPAAAAPAAASESPAAAPGQLSPLVQQGRILNTETGRVIKIGKAKYNELVMQGYQADLVRGELLPPS